MVTQAPYNPHGDEDEHAYNGFSRNNSADFLTLAVRAGDFPLSRTSLVSIGNNVDNAEEDALLASASNDEVDEDLNTIHK